MGNLQIHYVSFVRVHGLPPVPGGILDSFGFFGPSMALFGSRGVRNDREAKGSVQS